MTYGYPPPPEWRPPVPDEPDTGRTRGAAARRGTPQAPPPAKHVPPSGGLPTQPPAPPAAQPYSPQPYPYSAQPYSAQPASPPPPYPRSPQAYPPSAQPYGGRTTSQPYTPAHGAPAFGAPPTPARSTPPAGPPQSLRRPPPNNQAAQPKAYPNFPPPVPTSPTPRMPLPTTPRPAPAPTTTGALRTGPGNPLPAGRPSNFLPPTGPGRKPPPRGPIRPALPATKRPRTVSFREVPGLIRQLPHHKPWMVAIGAIAVVVVLSVCGLGSYLLVKDDSQIIGAAPTAESTVLKRDISNREADPNPLTANDVFPTTEIVVDPNIPPYKRIGDPQIADDCRVGANGDVGTLLKDNGCSQVVRATFLTPDGGHYVTAGIFNMPDMASAVGLTRAIGKTQGSILGYAPNIDPKTLVLVRKATKSELEVRGHFVLYVVYIRADGAPFDENDPNPRVIVYDILQKYLRDHVINEWSIDKAALTRSANP
jgi:hypothetical protein